MDQNTHCNSPIIYKIDSPSENQNEIQSDLSTSSKSNQNKKHQQETQVSQIPADHFQTTQIIKIKPLLNIISQNQQKINSFTSNPKQNQLQSLVFSQSSEDKQEQNSSQQNQDLQSPAKLRRTKRKRQRQTTKKKIQYQKETIFDESQISMNQQNPTEMRQFKQMEKMLSYYQIEDSQRYFDIKKEVKSLAKQNENETQQIRIYDFKEQIQFQRKRFGVGKQYQQQAYDVNQFEQDQEQQNEGQNIYQNDDGSQQESINRQEFDQKHSKVKVLRNLPKQIIVQTTVQTLVMNPVPEGLKLSCMFVINKKMMGLSTQYNLIINSTNRTVLSAKKQHFSFTSSNFILSMNQNYITKRKDNLGFLGRLISNFSGTQYELTKRILMNQNEHIGSQSRKEQYENQKIEKQNESLQAIIGFQNNLWGYGGMRKMEITKLNKQKLTQKDKIKKVNFQQIYERGQMSKLMKIQTCKPVYNKTTKRYIIDFGNKVKIPSAKNMILQYTQSQKDKKQTQKINGSVRNKKTAQNCLLIAKQKDDHYLVQIMYPLSLYEAFATCLANNDSKLLVN